MELPPSSVWIHEKAIYHLISAPKGETFGERNSLTCLMNGIAKGYCGNKKMQEHVMLGYHAELQKEDNVTHISYQEMGDDEPFSRGELLGTSLIRPRWFRLGEPVMELALQTAIVGELTGQSVDQPDPVNRRRANNFMAFVRGDVKDGGYGRRDVPAIVYNYHTAFHQYITTINHYHAKDGGVNPRAFDQLELVFH